MSKYTAYTVPDLLTLGSNIVKVLQSPAGAGYPLDDATAANLTAADASLQAAENAQTAAMIAAKTSTATKLVHRDEVASQIATIQATLVASPSVTDPMLVALGFPPRRAGKPASKIPVAATGLTATPDGLGNVALKWERGDASRSTVTYLVEFSLDAGSTWSLLDTTKRVSIKASNFAPGVAAWFRVTATSAAGRAQPSPAASVYAPTPAVELKIAA